MKKIVKDNPRGDVRCPVCGEVMVFPCSFSDEVVCPYKRSDKFALLGKCKKCPHYLRFLREMDEEDARVMEEIDRIRRTGEWV